MNSYLVIGQPKQPRHKVFVSYHHANDEYYRNRFERLFTDIHEIMVSKSVQIGEIDPTLRTETVRQKIRDEYLHDSTVTVVLVGKETWKRKHVDWEIGSSIRDTKFNARSGLLGIILPTYPMYFQKQYDPYTIPPRLYNNIECKYAGLYIWSEDPKTVANWIQAAFTRRDTVLPDNSFPSYVNNRQGFRWQP